MIGVEIMSRNNLYALVGVLTAALLLLAGYLVYQQSQQPHLEISVGKGGIEVSGHG